jgi:hypothetical protein
MLNFGLGINLKSKIQNLKLVHGVNLKSLHPKSLHWLTKPRKKQGNPDFRRRVNCPALTIEEIESRLIELLTPLTFANLKDCSSLLNAFPLRWSFAVYIFSIGHDACGGLRLRTIHNYSSFLGWLSISVLWA